MTMITVEDYREQYDTEDDIITSGKFQGTHLSVPYFWDAAMNGDAISLVYLDGTVYFLTVGDSDLELFPDLKDYYGLCLYETDGFIQCIWFETSAGFIEAQSNPDELI